MSNEPERTTDGLPIIPPLPEPPAPGPADGAIAVCGLCGLRIGRVIGYVCYNPRCGVFPRVTCGTSLDAVEMTGYKVSFETYNAGVKAAPPLAASSLEPLVGQDGGG